MFWKTLGSTQFEVELMMSRLLLGILGFVIVFGSIVGGMLAGGYVHHWLTPNIRFMYMIWLWIGMTPFMWICSRTIPPKCNHTEWLSNWLSALPLLVVAGIILDVWSDWILENVYLIAFLMLVVAALIEVPARIRQIHQWIQR